MDSFAKKKTMKHDISQGVFIVLLCVFICFVVGFPVILQTMCDALPGWLYENGYNYYYYEKGKKYVDCTAMIGEDVYRFDFKGRCYTNQWFQDQNGERYYYAKAGKMLCDAWQDDYYLLEDGKMARNQFVDRVYLGENGQWEENNWDIDHWRVDGDWRIDINKVLFMSDSGQEQEIDIEGIKSINYLGWDTGEKNGMPQQSLVAFEEALKHGFDTLLCGVRFTSDHIPVCFYSESINDIARNADGSEIEGGEVKVAESTYEQLNAYDYGIYKSEVYKGTKLLTLGKMLDSFSNNKIKELYIWLRGGSADQVKKAVQMANQHVIKISWVCANLTQAKAVIEADPNARVSIYSDNTGLILPDLLSLKNGTDEVFVFAQGNAILDAKLREELEKNGIAFEMGVIDSPEEVIRYWNGEYAYCSGIASNTVVASEIDVKACVEKIQGE